MRSIQNKFIILILACILLSAVTIGGAGILHAARMVDTDSEEIMDLTCRLETQNMDMLFNGIEHSVDMLSVYAQDRLESVEMLGDDDYRTAYDQELDQIFASIAGQTEGAVAYYVRYNPEVVPADSGFFYTRNEEAAFRRHALTDISAYDPADTEHVGWYYIPVNQGKAVWIQPYWNDNIGIYMISYVVPLYSDGRIFGVAGMDIDFRAVEKWVDSVKVYNTGTAFLADDKGNVLYRANQKEEAAAEIGNDSKVTYFKLANGMRLGLEVPNAELDERKRMLIYQVGMLTAGIAVLFILLTTLMTRRIVRPLKQLTVAAKKIAEGNLDIELSCHTRDEVASLTASFQETIRHLQKYISTINGLAYQDSLTGVKNKTAYMEAVECIEKKLETEQPEFAVAVLDVNGLKQVNDYYGHEAGDRLLIGASRMIENIFANSPVFRIGGDEFVLLLEGDDLTNAPRLFEQMERAMEKTAERKRPEQRISIAYGIALYDAHKDRNYKQLFQRADKAMYEKKAKMKKGWRKNAGAV